MAQQQARETQQEAFSKYGRKRMRKEMEDGRMCDIDIPENAPVGLLINTRSDGIYKIGATHEETLFNKCMGKLQHSLLVKKKQEAWQEQINPLKPMKTMIQWRKRKYTKETSAVQEAVLEYAPSENTAEFAEDNELVVSPSSLPFGTPQKPCTLDEEIAQVNSKLSEF